MGKLRDGDRVRVVVDRVRLVGSIDFVGTADAPLTPEAGAAVLAAREPHPALAPGSFDVVTMWHSLEHVHHQLATTVAARRGWAKSHRCCAVMYADTRSMCSGVRAVSRR